MSIYNKSKNWTHYLTRPFTLFGCSLWYEWYSNYAKAVLKQEVSDVLFVEETTGVVRSYRLEEHINLFKKSVESLVRDNPQECNKMLDRALEYNKEAEGYLKEDTEPFLTLEDSVYFLVNHGFYSTAFPFWVLLSMEKLGIENSELAEKSEKLRALSFYSRIIEKIIIPKAADILKKNGIKDPLESVDLLTLNEILNKDFSYLEERKETRRKKELFVYQVVEKISNISWLPDTSEVIEELEGETKIDGEKEVKGQIAFSGKVQGIARIFRTKNLKESVFNEGDILVSINSSPDLMPLIIKSSAIVTDDGGRGCHAAIISRELKKPCIIGTKIATKVFKDGDMVEVDADKGVVRKIS